MLNKNNRVTKELFQKIMKDGKILSGSVFLLRYLPQIANKPIQIAFVAPKSMAKTAVKRNKLRRQGYNAYRSISSPSTPSLPPTSAICGIFFYKKQNKNFETSEIKADISNMLSKVK